MYVKVTRRGVERSLPGAVTTRRGHQERRNGCGIGGTWRGPYLGPSQFVCAHQEWRKGCGIGGKWVERSLPGAVTIRPCPPGAKEGVGQLQELERSLNRGHHGLSLPNRTEVNTCRSPDTWKEPTCSMESNEGWRSQELRSTLQRRTNIPAQSCWASWLFQERLYTMYVTNIRVVCFYMVVPRWRWLA